jgi:SagB-type dehydrogenase family enzyme
LRAIDFDRLRESLSLGESHLLLHAFAGGQATDTSRESISPAANEASAAYASGGIAEPMPSPWRQIAARPVSSPATWIQGTLQSSATAGTLANEIDRLEFKLQDAGLRRLEDGQAQTQLSKPERDENLVMDFSYRRSDRDFLQEVIPFEEFSLLISCLLQEKMERTGVLDRLDALPASSYPIQAYVYVKKDRVDGVGGGTYRINPTDNRLELLSPDARIENSAHAPANREIAEGSAFLLLLVADANLVTTVFGDWARDLCLLEAGYIGQALMTEAPAHQIGLCPVGSMDFDRIRHLFGIDETQSLLHSFLAGSIPPRRPGQRARHSKRRTKPVQDPDRLSSITKALSVYLSSKLPDYMVPPVITVLDDLPLSSNGKVDRNALATLRADQFEEDVDFVPPRTATEQSLAAVWRELLGVERIGVADNFFSLGGDSVQAIQFLARARGIGYEIGIQYFFEHPTIDELAVGASEVEPEQAETATADEMSGRPAGLTVEEFPDAELSQDELNELIAQFARDDDQGQKAEDH